MWRNCFFTFVNKSIWNIQKIQQKFSNISSTCTLDCNGILSVLGIRFYLKIYPKFDPEICPKIPKSGALGNPAQIEKPVTKSFYSLKMETP